MGYKRTPAEQEALREMATAIRKFREAEEQAKIERLRKTAEGMGFSLTPSQEKNGGGNAK
jgi:hypothetical protein